MPLELRVPHRRAAAGPQAVGHGEDHEPAPVLPLEAAVAIAEAALVTGELDHLSAKKVEGADTDDRLRDVLSVGPHVLHGGRAHEAGDARQALQARPTLRDRALDDGVPGLARPRGQVDRAVRERGVDAAREHVEGQAGEALVGDHEVAAPPQDEQGKALGRRPLRALEDGLLALGAQVVAGGPADAERGEAGQRHVGGEVARARDGHAIQG